MNGIKKERILNKRNKERNTLKEMNNEETELQKESRGEKKKKLTKENNNKERIEEIKKIDDKEEGKQLN